jgi:hypothetical protein
MYILDVHKLNIEFNLSTKKSDADLSQTNKFRILETILIQK